MGWEGRLEDGQRTAESRKQGKPAKEARESAHFRIVFRATLLFVCRLQLLARWRASHHRNSSQLLSKALVACTVSHSQSQPTVGMPLLDRFRQHRDELTSSNSPLRTPPTLQSSRLSTQHQENFTAAALLSLDGAALLLQRGQGNAGGELGELLVTCYTKCAIKPSSPR